jgi:hypothetical protein
LNYKLRNTARLLHRWSSKFVGNIRLLVAMAREEIHKLDQAQDLHVLSAEEDLLRRKLKVKCLGLATLSRTIAC